MQKNKWTETIKPDDSIFNLKLKEVWNYRDLLMMFVKRDFLSNYKQTILGPLWFIIQPILTTLMFTLVFGNFAKISSNGMPKPLFYLAGITIWNFFADTFNKTSNVFIANASIFGKVYFPRLIVPLSIVVSGAIKFAVQFGLFICFILFYLFKYEDLVRPNFYAFLLPLHLIMMAGFSLGIGLIISAMTIKYRDFTYLVSFGVTLFMYATPIIYPLDSLSQKYKAIAMINPLSSIVESFRYGWLGSGFFSWGALSYSFLVMFIILSIGVVIFNKVEKSFMDSV
jgi:lipopolysaccharide transport system permease protein